MLRVKTLASDLKVPNQAAMEKMIAHLSESGYTPLVRNMLKSLFSSACLPFPDESALATLVIADYPYRGRRRILTDVFLMESDIFVLNCGEATNTISASVIGMANHRERLQSFCDAVVEGWRICTHQSNTSSADPKWRDHAVGSPYPRRVLMIPPESSIPHDLEDQEATPSQDPLNVRFLKPDYTDRDVELARFLTDNSVRQFLLTLAQSRKIPRRSVLSRQVV